MIQNRTELIRNGITPKQRKIRRDLCAILEHVLTAIDPYALVKQNVQRNKNILTVGHAVKLNLKAYRHVYIVGAGKAVYGMARAMEEMLQDNITGGWINIPSLPKKNKLKKVIIHKARHPTPDSHGVSGAKQIKKILQKAGKDDLVIAVISGGGSALMPLPAEGITLKEKIALTSLLLKTPATIHEINVVRKHLSQIKGGQFACVAYPATLVALYISDIIDDPFDIQASGPTAPDPSTFEHAIAILKKYNIWNKTPDSIKKRLAEGMKGKLPETPGADHEAFRKGKIYNLTIGNHNTAVEAAGHAAKKLGYHALELTSAIQGEAQEVSKEIIAIGKHIARYGKPVRRPAIVIAGGETTVHVRGKGKGGRNQELVLSAIPSLQEGMAIVSFGTDGVDGITPTPIAGAIADVATRERAASKKLNTQKFLTNNDSYHFFAKASDHVITDPTGTNVGDLILLVAV